jgi:cytochrome c1
VADLVAYLQWMASRPKAQRVRLGVWVLLFLACSP